MQTQARMDLETASADINRRFTEIHAEHTRLWEEFRAHTEKDQRQHESILTFVAKLPTREETKVDRAEMEHRLAAMITTAMKGR
jgi:lipopolysaccharide biosynthesis protein